MYFKGPSSEVVVLAVLISSILFSKAKIESFTISSLAVTFSSDLEALVICLSNDFLPLSFSLVKAERS